MTKQPDNIKDGKRVPIQHGEVWMQPVDNIPDGTTTKHKMFVVGHSESGHNHVLESKTEFTVIDGVDRTILLDEVATLFHKKSFDIHETRTIAPGAYKVYIKSEYDPFQQVVRQLWD